MKFYSVEKSSDPPPYQMLGMCLLNPDWENIMIDNYYTFSPYLSLS